MKPIDTQSKHLLLVDDDRLVLATLAEGLRRSGYLVTTAENGKEALARAAEQKFGLALVDVRMPGIPGTELTKQLLEAHGCFSIILSAYGDSHNVKEATQNGALGYLIKPVDVAKVVPAVETALARAREIGALMTVKEQLDTALRQGRETGMAVGVLMERMHLDREAAFSRLRDSARSERRRINETAESVLRAVETLNCSAR